MKSTSRIRAALALFLAIGPGAPAVHSHEGEQHGTPPPKAGAIGGPVTLSAEARENLAIETAVVGTRSILSGPTAFGSVEPLPGRHQVVAARVAGRVTRVFKFAGESVAKGEAVLEMESRAIADPPVRITLESPLTGIVTANPVDPGGPVEADQVLMEMADLSAVRFRMDVFEVDFGQVAMGQKAIVALEAYPSRRFEGTITRIGGAADRETRTVPVWINLDNADRSLLLNLRGRAQVATTAGEPVIAVPSRSVLGDPANRFVYLDAGDALVPTPVVIGQRDPDWTEIRRGLIPGDVIVVTGNYELQFVVSPEPKAPEAGKTAAGSKGR